MRPTVEWIRARWGEETARAVEAERSARERLQRAQSQLLARAQAVATLHDAGEKGAELRQTLLADMERVCVEYRDAALAWVDAYANEERVERVTGVV